MLVSVYIDGFNLYYAIRKRGFKWLNPKALCAAALPAVAVINRINYYTARVSGAVDPGAPGRQQIYLNALSTIPEVKFYWGNFLAKAHWRPILNLPIADRDVTDGTVTSRFSPGVGSVGIEAGNPKSKLEAISIAKYSSGNGGPSPHKDSIKASVFAMEEKGSDVNLAVHLVNDAWAGVFDAAAVVTNDTDLVEPIRIVTQERGKPVYLLCPHPCGASVPLRLVAT